jgi:hypothetical protein
VRSTSFAATAEPPHQINFTIAIQNIKLVPAGFKGVNGKFNKFPGAKNQQVICGLQQLLRPRARRINGMRTKTTLKKENIFQNIN